MALRSRLAFAPLIALGFVLAGCGGSSDTAEAVGPVGGYDGGKDGATDAATEGGQKVDKDKDGYDSSVDCDDNNAAVHPGAKEICNGIDDNCVAGPDEGVSTSYYPDKDKDGFGADALEQKACSAPAGYITKGGDCDDNSAAIHPGVAETCNSADDDCNGKIDDGVGQTYYVDTDLDGFGVDSAQTNTKACKQPTGYAAANGDCDDTKSSVHPGATELCNQVDDNCDGKIDNGAISTFYVDSDGDGFGVDDPATNITGCAPASGFAPKSGDCDNKNASVFPGAVEIEGNGIDEDCNGSDIPCAEGLMECNGAIKRACLSGVWSAPEDCGAKLCSQFLGCVVCIPGTASCTGGVSHYCRADGQGWEDEECDPLLGSVCDAGSGVCTGPCSKQALGRSYIGCDFYPTVTQQIDGYNSGANQFGIAISNTSATPTSVTITRGATTVNTTTVAAHSLAKIYLPWVNELTLGTGPSVVVPTGAYRVRTNNPVTVYQYNPIEATVTNDASLLLPSNAWTAKYVVASWPHWAPYVGFYAVVASQNATTVTLAPSATGKIVQAGGGVSAVGTGVVSLNRGDVLQVMTAGGDLTGTGITATKPIQVISGHECTQVPIGTAACDHLEESMFPVETLATEYVIAPPVQAGGVAQKGQIVRVIATEAGTTITYTPDQPGAKTLANAGDFTEIPTSVTKYVINSNKRILVAQYMVGQDAGYGASDPAMLLAVSPRQWRKDYLIHAPVTWASNYVDLLAKTGTSVTVDGAAVAGWQAIGSTGFSVAHVTLGSATGGNHGIVGSEGVGVSVYGMVNYGSYWYPGGLDLTELAP